MKLSRLRIGPGLLVTAAFIGPGTVVTASRAGAGFGYDLVWALIFAIAATVILQEMSARLGVVTGAGLGEALRRTFEAPLLRAATVILVVSAITFGNAAYQMGNITGAASGLEILTGVSVGNWALIVGVAAAGVLATGWYVFIERVLIALVVVMSVVFMITAVMVGPDVMSILRGARPSLPEGSRLTVIALIGTTVVPYNLFLHASAAREKWGGAGDRGEALTQARWDSTLSVLLGGGVTLAILITAAAAFPRGTSLESVLAMATQLEPLLGHWARDFFAIGFGAAGLTSAITAPLAAAYATRGVMGWTDSLASTRFRLVWGFVLVVGTLLAGRGWSPTAAITFAQAANGFLLPIVAAYLLVVMNRSALLGTFRNRWPANVAGVLVVGFVVFLVWQKLAPLAARLIGADG